MVIDISAEQKKAQETIENTKNRILVCSGTGCVASGAQEVLDKFNELGAKAEFKGCYHTVQTGCHGFCEQGVLIVMTDKNITYTHVKVDDVEEIIEKHIMNGEIVERLLYKDINTGEVKKSNEEINFYAKQTKSLFANCGKIDPENINEYFAIGGYQALDKVLKSMTPAEVINEVINSGLRGRGGGGFPTGKKWSFMQNSTGKKYVVCNADEGDPGAFMDCGLMEGEPHKVLEGMAIAAFAVGADEGYIYVRAEYPLAVKRLKLAIQDAEEKGLLGDNILGTGFNFKLKIKEGAGAFVCGEETALIASIEGERGMPRPKPPFPAIKGLFGKPTLINNVETFANVPVVIMKGSEEYARIGSDNSKGTKTFALTGEVNNTGLIEVPLGTTLKEIVFDIGGGIRGGKKFKAVQIGGPSGGCLTEEHFDLSMDYDSLVKAGAMVGSGGLVVTNEDTCIVELARFFMSFTQNESCGKCVPCREGTKNMLKILTDITQGKATMEDLDLLQELAMAVKDGSLCGLGKTAPNPVLSTLKYFYDEYVAHIKDKKCPAGVCTALKTIIIEEEKCVGCTKCARQCPVEAIEGKVKEIHKIDQSKCIKCGVCIAACPFKAIKEI